jgi:hypothetical protein
VCCFLNGKTCTQSLKTTKKQSPISLARQFCHIKTADFYGKHIPVREHGVPTLGEVTYTRLGEERARVRIWGRR